MGVEVVQQGQWPHDEFGVVPPERHTRGGAEGIEVAVGDGPPGLGVGGEVPSQREPAVLEGAERDHGHQLQPEEEPAKESDPPGQPLVAIVETTGASSTRTPTPGPPPPAPCCTILKTSAPPRSPYRALTCSGETGSRVVHAMRS